MKLFGRDLFQKQKESMRKPKEQYDFAQHGILSKNYEPVAVLEGTSVGYVQWTASTPGTTTAPTVAVEPLVDTPPTKKKDKKKPEPIKVSPKELYQAKALNREDLYIITDSAYLKEQIDTLSKKVNLLKNTDNDYGATKYGKLEIESMIERLHNRFRLFPGHSQYFYEQYPYTTNEAIRSTLEEHSHLQAKRANEFVPDLPKDAIDTMTAYTEATQRLCGKNPIFYIIADKKDFGEIGKKRDPILLAQSPFGFFWQILGAWDKEMILLEEL